MLQAYIYLNEHYPAVGGAPVGKSNSLAAGEGYHRPVSSSRARWCLLPFSDFAAVRFPTTAIVANLRSLLQEILIKKERMRSNGGFESCVARACTRYNTLRASPKRDWLSRSEKLMRFN